MNPYIGPYKSPWEDEMERIRRASAQMGVTPEQLQQGTRESLTQRASQDLTGQENAIENQRAYANMLRGRAAPQGREVGPLGVYIAPNWGEQLRFAGEQALGGYLSGRADREDKALDAQRGLAKAAGRDLEQMDVEEQRGFTTEERRAAEAARADLNQTNIDARADAAALAYENQRTLAEEAGERNAAQAALDRQAKAAEAEADRAHDIRLEQLKADLENDALNAPDSTTSAIENLGSQTERKAARTYINSIKMLDEIAPRAEQLLEEGKSWNSPTISGFAAAAGAIPAVGETFRGMIKSAGYDEDESQMRQDLLASFTEFRRSLTGANLTAMERFIEEEGDPLQDGIGPKESYRRLLRLRDHMAGRLETMGVPMPGEEQEEESNMPQGTEIRSGAYAGMIKGNDGKVYDQNGVAVARWR